MLLNKSPRDRDELSHPMVAVYYIGGAVIFIGFLVILGSLILASLWR